MTATSGTELINDYLRADQEHKLSGERRAKALAAVIADIRLNGDVETMSCVYTIIWDSNLRDYVLVTEPIAYRGLPAEEVAAWR